MPPAYRMVGSNAASVCPSLELRSLDIKIGKHRLEVKPTGPEVAVTGGGSYRFVAIGVM